MIHFSQGFPSDQTGDKCDSALRVGILTTFGEPETSITKYVDDRGICRRCPVGDANETNPWNFTADQLIALVAGLWRIGEIKIIRRIFWAHVRRFFFCQNFERDMPGTTKKPWPHWFINDHGVFEFRWFDFADPLAPNRLWFLIVAGKIWPLYLFGIVGWPVIVLQILFGSKRVTTEINQMICMIEVFGLQKFFKRVRGRSWIDQLEFYWFSRKEKEYSDLIIRKLSGVTNVRT